MSRDAAGNWIPLAPVVGGTVITSTWANNMMTSFGADVTESLDRSGRGGMLVPLRIASGTKLEPGYSWTAELSTGFYRPLGGFDMRTSIGGKDIFRWNANGAQISPDDGVTWEAVLTNGGASGQVPVDAGTVQGQTLRWDQTTDQEWQATSDLVVDDVGNVGIGISDPLFKLHIDGNINFDWGGGTDYQIGSQFSDGSLAKWSIGTIAANQELRIQMKQSSTPHITFYTGSGDTERMRIDPSGNVGIGTTAPDAFSGKLVVFDQISAVDTVDVITMASNFTSNIGAERRLRWQWEAGGKGGYIGCQVGSANGSSAVMTFGLTDVERMRIDAAGNVGIGTVAPAWKLVVESDNSVPILAKNTGGTLAAISFQGSTTSTDLRVRMGADGENAVFLTAGTERMRIDDTGRVGIGTLSPQATLSVAGNAAITLDGVNDGALISAPAGVFDNSVVYGFYFNSLTGISHPGSDIIGFKTANTEAMRIISNQKLLVGMTAQYSLNGTMGVFNNEGAATPVATLGTNSTDTSINNFLLAFRSSASAAGGGNGQGSINCAGASAAQFGAFSDRRLKENIEALPPQLANINAMRPVSFDFIAGGSNVGFIAQEVQEIYPDCVGEGEDEMLVLVGWSRTEARMVKAIQELTARVEALGG